MRVWTKLRRYWWLLVFLLAYCLIYAAKTILDEIFGEFAGPVMIAVVGYVLTSPILLPFVFASILLLGGRLIFLELERRAKLIIKCGPEIGKCKARTPINDPPATDAIFWRVQVTNQGFKPIKNCTGVVHAVKREGTPLLEEDNLELTWASKNEDRTREDIRRGANYYLDVLRVNNRNKVFLCPSLLPMFLLKKPLFSAAGTYFIHVTIIADDMIPCELVLQFNYTSDWETSELFLLSDSPRG